ncbi:hypothetical protein KIH74_19750 [Kineosporia sp. J2-2]|uniref:ABC-2 type transport system permease protein n=1 Tax=Kineosporia corallincola TaxID=2835133 RepID=A0ABS5TJC5_9ACTN|nr:hypothetical protein [Kineosporia corallincola]MBT0771185.1 hypothetical protein [Kineosporia corallincola]
MITLTRFALRRDRVRLTVWLLGIACVPSGVATTLADLYPDVASRRPLSADLAHNPGLLAFTGPADNLLSLGGLVVWRGMGTTCILAAIMNFLLVLRHTRADEESGRLELLRSAPVRRSAPLDAALLTALIADLVLALLIAAGLIGAGLPAGGSLRFGLATAACGLFFAGLAAVTAQLTEFTRPATGVAAAGLATAYLLRAVGDSSGPHWLAWLSPIGWAQRSGAFGGGPWWTTPAALLAAGLLALAARRLEARRDFGGGIVASRPGPARATRLGSSFALAWRLQRGTLLAWTLGLAGFGLVSGGLAEGVGGLVDDSPQLADVLSALGGEQSVVDSYLATVFGIYGLLAGAYAVSALLRLRAEETEGRAEALLATPVGHLPWAAGHLAIALGGVAVMLLAAALTTGLTYGLAAGDLGGALPDAVRAAIGQIIAAWVFAGLGLLLFGLLPSAAPGAWAAIAGAAVLYLLGDALNLPQAVLDVSPFTHLPALPGGDPSVTPWLWLLTITALLAGAGLTALNRRDLH